MKKLIAGALTAVMTMSLFAAPAPIANAAATDNTKAAGTEITLPKSNGNPITGFDENGNIIYAGDPGVLVDGDTVYLYVGHDNTAGDGGYSMPDWLCYSTKDLETWEYHGVVASADKSYIPWAGGNEAWAGQVMKHRDPDLKKDYYYFYYCSNGTKHIGVAVADTPLGWSDIDAKEEYCTMKGIKDNNPQSTYFVDIGVPLVRDNVTWPYHMGHDDIDPTAWVEKDEQGVEHRYLAWGNSYCFITELNEDMISIKDKDGNGLITMKTTRSLLTTNGSVALDRQSFSRTQVVDAEYGYPQAVTYQDLNGSHTIDKGDVFPNGEIICSKFRTYNTYDYEGKTPYAYNGGIAVDNDGKSMENLLVCDDDYMLNGLFTWKEKDGAMAPCYHFFTEAPFLYRRQDENGKPYGKYYLFFAVDYSEQLAYATCTDLNKADWEFQDILLPWNPNSDTRHPSVFDFKGKTYLIDHNASLPWGLGKRRVTYIEEINFNEDGKILPVEDTATGLTGTTSWIADSNGANVTHENFLVPQNSGPYTPEGNTAKKVGMTATADPGDSKWEIVAGKAEPTNASYVSIESWNRPGLYLRVSGTDIVLAQHATKDNNVSNDANIAKSMTFKTVAGLNGKADTVSFESVSQENMYLTSQDNDLILTDGTDKDACTFTVTSRNALKSISAQKTKTIYKKGEALNTSDIKVTATRQGGVTEAVTGFTINTQGIDMNTLGKKTITVTYQEDNFIRTADIEIAVAQLSLTTSKLSLKKGASQTLMANVTPSGLKVEWSSAKPSIAKVDQNGKVTAMGNGTTTITAKLGSMTASCTVTVTTDVSSVKISKKTLSLDVGKKITLTATPSPATASSKKASWKSSNNKIAAVGKDGKVTAKKPGTATITATIGSKKASCKVTVKGISKLNKTKLSLKRGKSFTLKATTIPKNTKVTWKTSNKKVATVKNGKVTAKGKGTATITAKAGKSSIKCKVTVKK